MTIKPIIHHKKQFLDLLLLADEQENMIDRYLDQGEMFALYDGDLKAVCVVVPVDHSTCELKNIATHKKYQRQGYGNILVHYLFRHYKKRYKTMLVGTGDHRPTLSFYERCGFMPSHRIRNFFTDHYDHPMFEDGIQLIDMVYLKKDLTDESTIHIREAVTSDIHDIQNLFQNTVLSINRRDYSSEETEDWASCGDDPAHLSKLLAEQYWLVAENEKPEITGFASICDPGYLDHLFVHKDFQQQGIASLLYQALEKYAKQKGIIEITSEVSITAKPFFEKQGFSIDEKQQRKANALYLTNYKMSKKI